MTYTGVQVISRAKAYVLDTFALLDFVASLSLSLSLHSTFSPLTTSPLTLWVEHSADSLNYWHQSFVLTTVAFSLQWYNACFFFFFLGIIKCHLFSTIIIRKDIEKILY